MERLGEQNNDDTKKKDYQGLLPEISTKRNLAALNFEIIGNSVCSEDFSDASKSYINEDSP